ncbi:MAG: hypothetical protein KC649_06095 [Candidatus Omnitrophica bacterium]|nr:hypothetical protein [Candidatus Omnitrophota bacterium]
MEKVSKSLRSYIPSTDGKQSAPYGVILERFKKINAQGARRVDLVSEFFVQYYLRAKKSSI